MVTYNRPDYTRLALTRLLETCDERMSVWLWHNGDHQPTLAVTRELSAHPAVIGRLEGPAVVVAQGQKDLDQVHAGLPGGG